MAVGPDARRMASGRMVVVGGLDATMGAAAVALGLGPLIERAEPGTQLVGAAAIALGVVLLLAGGALLFRRGPVRLLGRLGGVAAMALGLVILVAAASSIGDCSASSNAAGCLVLLGVSGMLGVVAVTAGLAGLVVVSRAHAQALRRPGRRSGRSSSPPRGPG